MMAALFWSGSGNDSHVWIRMELTTRYSRTTTSWSSAAHVTVERRLSSSSPPSLNFRRPTPTSASSANLRLLFTPSLPPSPLSSANLRLLLPASPPPSALSSAYFRRRPPSFSRPMSRSRPPPSRAIPQQPLRRTPPPRFAFVKPLGAVRTLLYQNLHSRS